MTPMEILPIQQDIQDQNCFYKCSHYFVYESLRSLLIPISFFRTTVFQINCPKLLVIVLIKRCIKSFEFFFFIESHQKIRNVHYHFPYQYYFPYHLSSHFDQLQVPQVTPRQNVHHFLYHYHCLWGKNSPHFSNKSICKKIFIFLISISIPPIKHLINEQRYTFSLVLKPF